MDSLFSAKRIFNTMDWLEGKMHQDYNLDDLARRANYSKYHFERLFSEQVGQSPFEYLRRRKLLIAGMRVRHESSSITQIALESGFANSASFAKSFRQQFGYCARDWRHGAWRSFMDANRYQSSSPAKSGTAPTWLHWSEALEPTPVNLIHIEKLHVFFLYLQTLDW